MAKRNIAVAIGIGRAKPLPFLRGALNGARQFHEWATALGYESRLVSDETDPVTGLFAPYDVVTLNLAGGDEIRTREVRYPKGHARNPLSLEELRAKFDECTDGIRQELFQRILRLEDFDGEKSGTDHVYL